MIIRANRLKPLKPMGIEPSVRVNWPCKEPTETAQSSLRINSPGGPFGQASGKSQRSVVVTVIPVGMVQVPVHQVVDVITVRYRRMPTVRTVNMIFIVAFAVMGDAPVRVGL